MKKLHDHQSDEQCFDGSCGPNPFKKKTQHTPTPWKLDESKNILGLRDGEFRAVIHYSNSGKNAETWQENNANAAFIVRAVNLHEALLEVAKDALCELDPDCNYDGSNYNGSPSDKGNSRIQTILALYKIIAQTEGE